MASIGSSATIATRTRTCPATPVSAPIPINRKRTESAGDLTTLPHNLGRAEARLRPASSETLLERLKMLHPQSIDLSLGRIERLLAALGRPERRLPPVVPVDRKSTPP